MTWIQITQGSSERPVSGADLRNHQILQALRKLATVDRIEIESLDPRANADGHSRHLISQSFTPAQTDALLSRIGPQSPGLVLVEGASLASLLAPLRAAHPASRIVVDFHNVESDLLRQLDTSRLPAGLQWLAPLVFGHRWRAARATDMLAASVADAVWVCSRDDAVRARFIGIAGRIDVVPNPVPDWCAAMPEAPAHAATTMLFVGHLGYRPNKLAVRDLLVNILPAIRRTRPEARLIVAGRNPRRPMKEMAVRAGHCRLVENPVDLAPLYAEAGMVLLPIRIGGGTRIKAIEALAVGRPLVATRLAVEGLGLVAGTHYLAAETSADFVRAALDLAGDPALGATLVAAGRARVLATHGEAAIGNAIRMATGDLVTGGPPTSA